MRSEGEGRGSAAGALTARHGDGHAEAVPFAPGDTLLEALRAAGIVVLAPCGGAGTCGRCEVALADDAAPGGARRVLACQTPAEAGMEVLVDDLGAMSVEGVADPAAGGAGSPGPTGPAASAAPGGATTAEGTAPGGGATIAEGAARSEAPAPAGDARYGVAVDIGTTTIALYLVDLDGLRVLETAGLVNPQAPFGADVIARLEAAARPGGLTAQRDAVRAAVAEAAAGLCARRGIDPARVERVACAGNTVMECLAAGIDPAPLGVAPFTPPTLFGAEADLSPATPAPDADARDTGAPAPADDAGACGAGTPPPACPAGSGATPDAGDAGAAPSEQAVEPGDARGDAPLPALARAYLAPSVAAYVGGDITAGLHAAGMRGRDGLQLLVDIGTNGEMALGDARRIVCCATAAGPAFEGAGITFGMPALPGAIESVELDADALRVGVIGGGAARGLCGSGLLDAVACLIDAGIIDETGYLFDADEAVDEGVPAGLAARIGEEDGQAVCYLDPARRVWLSQADVRQTQLAKAAIRAGIEVLMGELGVTAADVEELALAGGFGSHLRTASAARIGLIPPELAGRTAAIGNAAGRGAVAALADEGRAALEDVAARCEYLELSTHPAFNDAYIEAMAFDE